MKSYFKLTFRSAHKFFSLIAALVCLMIFQNCENFGSFKSFDDLTAEDPHGDAWTSDKLEVKDGEWVKVEEQVEEKLRLTDRNYIASKLMTIAISGDESSNINKTINYNINSLVRTQINNFGGPCVYYNPETIPTGAARDFKCTGAVPTQVLVDAIPTPNVFRSSLKKAICDYLASNRNVQSNIQDNMEVVSDLVASDSIPYIVHQMFYLGQEPQERTLASLNNLYRSAAGDEALPINTFNAEGLKILTLALCHSNGWEAP